MSQLEPVVGITPFESPDAGLTIALVRAGALGVLDLGRDPEKATEALALVSRGVPDGFGVRIPDGVLVEHLPDAVRVVMLPASGDVARWNGRAVLVQVTSVAEARAALAAGAAGLIAKGNESGGRVGAEPLFILLQRLLKELSVTDGQLPPIWAQGGIGLHTAAACIAAGAHGVVLDSQLSLLREAGTKEDVRRAVAAMDGSETRLVAEHRIYGRPSMPPPPADTPPASIALRLAASDPRKDLLALGQDACFAKPLADRFVTVGGLVRGLRNAVTGHLRQARALEPLGPRSPFAAQHRLAYPIVQGPMTRVSDRAPFAEAVSRGGGLPFLALSLMRSDEARQLLHETAALHRDRTWGVGILGFVPAEIRDEQLALLLEVRPPVALIAGGRPSQARPLEDAGIATYLHVPSPGLLDMFLKDGARRFVFEGRECGGHVGPRSSLVLWETAIERLLAFEGASEVSVLFAGGIHDARSAAMVSAMAAPLAARGAKIGVLMGTAYLFTEEAVSSGAILPAFQTEAIECQDTVLLETAPGHATRAADTAFTRAFLEERRRLEGEQKSPQEIWEALEQYNLGRLRVAAKGLLRQGDRVDLVDEERQRRDGLYMIGQVATLRNARSTVAELHRDVSEGQRAVLARAKLADSPSRADGSHEPVDVAIVGMACIFPDAIDLPSFWANIALGRNAITEVPKERWNPELYFEATGGAGKTPSKWGGFIPDIPFDPAAYGIPPRSLAAIDPVQLLSLEVARRALADAGYDDGSASTTTKRSFDRDRTSVVIGAEAGADLANAYGFRSLYPQLYGSLPDELEAHLPKLTEDSFPGMLANVVAGRIANRLDLGGVNYTVDAACASSLAAVDVACKELALGTSDMVIAGGADLHNSINDYLLFASVHALSPTGQSRAFDASADGIVLGEGVAALVLKRLADAERAGDRIYAVIKGIGGSSDGKSLGLTAPRKEGQARALERAYERAGVSPADVGLVEGHGTGTVVGDKTELGTLTEFFGAAGALPRTSTLGSVKSHIGHTKCAAGLAGLIKAALALYHRVLPPTGNLRNPNPFYDPSTSPFVFREAATPWPRAPVNGGPPSPAATNAGLDAERYAGVSAFGFGGTNFHAVLKAYGEGAATSGLDEWPAELFVFRGATRGEAEKKAAALASFMAQGPWLRLRDVARTVADASRDGAAHIAIVAQSIADLRDKLERVGSTTAGVFVSDESATFGAEQVALIFPGQGSQRPGMLADLFVAFPDLLDLLKLGGRLEETLFPPTAFTREAKAAQRAAITDTRVAQPALGIAGLAMARLLDRFGVQGAMLAGHSYGELVALSVAGAIPETALVEVSKARAAAILDAASGAPGTMAAVSASAQRVREVLAELDTITLANHNAPDQTVIAGSDEAIAEAVSRLSEANVSARPIQVACAFHSPIVAQASGAFAEFLAHVEIKEPRRIVYANTTAERYPKDANAIRSNLARQLALPVRFAEEIEAMYAAGARIFVEAGPGTVLTDLVGRNLRGRPHVAVACDRSGTHGLTALLTALAELAVAGVPVKVDALYEGRDARLLDFTAAPVGPPPTAWLVNGQGARPMRGELPEHAMRMPTCPLAPPARDVATPRGTEREAALLEYLENMRAIVEGQRQVMLRFLGEAPSSIALGPSVDAPPETRPVLSALQPKAPPQPVPRLPAPVSAELPEPSSRTPLSPLEALVSTVSERTGYPPEMLDPDLDLEADLGIDSIKRIEILGIMRDKLDLTALNGVGRAEVLEQLAGVKTLRKIAGWLESHMANAPSGPASPHKPATNGATASTSNGANGVTKAVALLAPTVPEGPLTLPSLSEPPSSRGTVARYVFELNRVPSATPNGVRVTGRTFAILPDARGVAPRLAALLESRGALVRLLGPDEELGDVDGLVQLATLSRESYTTLGSLFTLTKEAARKNATWIIGASGFGGTFGHGAHVRRAPGGISGLLKSVSKERPELRVRAVDLHPDEDPARLAEHIYAELLADDTRVEVGYTNGERHALRAVAREPDGGTKTLRLDSDSVVMVTGGARGITAEVAVALARQFGCHLELVGRSPFPGDHEDPELAPARDAPSLRRLLLERAFGAGPTTPAAIESLCKQVLVAREVRNTISRIREAGAQVTYHAADVRDDEAFGAIIDGIYARYGRLDGVIHGAGVTEDKLLSHKTRESFDRVFDTKVRSAHTLARKVRADVRLLAFFSSVSGAFGNRGQADYAAANDALDKLALELRDRLPGARVVSINWGPWSGVGMVSAELEREYQRRGVRLIAPEEGAARFIEEVCRGDGAQVVLMAETSESLE